LDNSGISVALPMRPQAITSTIVPPPARELTTCVHREETGETKGSDEGSGDSEQDEQSAHGF